MTEQTRLVGGEPVPADRSHTQIDPRTGMQRDYVVLSDEERKKGFVKPVRLSYRHTRCNTETRMSREIAETYARNPSFYSGTFCSTCREHFPLSQFVWLDGETMDPAMQAQAEAVEKQAQDQAKDLKADAKQAKLNDEQAVLDDERARAKAEPMQVEQPDPKTDSK